MDRIELTEALVLDLLDEAVAEKGEDHLYENPDEPGACTYVHGYDAVETRDEYGDLVEREFVQADDLTPGCIVGDVLHRAGVPLELFQELNINYDTQSSVAMRILAKHGAISYSGKVEGILSFVQGLQDDFVPWGQAVASAKQACSE